MEKEKTGFRETLFRKEVLENKKAIYLGKVIIISPVSFSIWSLIIFGVTVVLSLFLYFG